MAHELEGAVRNHFVGIHIDGSAGAALHHVHRELVVELAVHDFLAGLDNGVRDGAVQHAEFGVGLRGGHLHVGDRDDVLRIVEHLRRGNLVIVEGPLGLDAIVGVGRYLELAEEVAFDPEFGFRHI